MPPPATPPDRSPLPAPAPGTPSGSPSGSAAGPDRRRTAAASSGTPQRWWWRGVWAAVGVVALAALALALAVAWYLPQLPPLDKVLSYQPRQHLQVYTADGVELAQFGAERRQFVPIGQMPPLLLQALVAVEDRRYYQHHGVDPRGVARALLANLRGRREGASTITQQVARNFFLSQQRTAERKIKEALLALRIERQLSKAQILELYTNQIFLGQRAYGFAAAADTYFGKPLDQLGLAELALLAGLPQAPGWANPITNLARATQRQHEVLRRMVDAGVISEAQATAARAQVLTIRQSQQPALPAGHVAEMVRQLLFDRYGAEAYTQGLRVTTTLRAADQRAAHAALRRGLLAYDARQPWRGPEAQEDLPDDAELTAAGTDSASAAALALREHADDEQLRVAIVLQASSRSLLVQLASGEQLRIAGDGLRLAQAGLSLRAPEALALRRGSVIRVMATASPGARAGGASAWRVVQWPQADGALVALDAASGRVRALVGGFDFGRQPFNHVTQARRQPGSAFKPLLYSAALEHGLMPDTRVDDAPLQTADGWQPANADGQYAGPITLRDALAYSKNAVSVRVLQQLGVPTALAWAGRFGLDTRLQPNNLTLALGAGSVTPMQLAQAYAVLANGGWRVNPLLIERIVDARGQTLFQAPPDAPADESRRALPARNVWLSNSLLAGVTRYGTAARVQQRLQRDDLYGKTGTTNDAVDAWFAGFQSDGRQGLVAVTWIGHDQPRSLGEGESGGGLALPVWLAYMETALRGVPVAPPAAAPDGLVEVDGDWRYTEWAEIGSLHALTPDDGAASAAATSQDGAVAPDAPGLGPAAGTPAGVPPASTPAAAQATPTPSTPPAPVAPVAPAAPVAAP